MAIVLDGTNASTFSGKISKSSLPTGSVLQVVSVTSGSTTTVTSSSYLATALVTSITPSSATSKILITFSVPAYATNAGSNVTATIFRGTTSGTNLGQATYGFGTVRNSAVTAEGVISGNYLDSPATTSATTYTIAIRCSSGTGYASVNGDYGTITLMEIAA